MCRNIKKLRDPNRAPTDAELHDAALQFVRKISGYNAPSRANQQAFDTAVSEIATVARKMFRELVVGHAAGTRGPQKSFR
jgi:hypothetical protein